MKFKVISTIFGNKLFSVSRRRTGYISPGSIQNIGTYTVGPEGGVVLVTSSNTILDGLEIEIPEGTYNANVTITVSCYDITSHQLGPLFNPLTPVIRIEDGGQAPEKLMTMKIPVRVPKENTALIFYYDHVAGGLEGLPLVSESDGYVTTRVEHYSDFVVNSILRNLFSGKGKIATGYLPGVDDWHLPNNGSFITPHGNCLGEALSSIWYYLHKKQSSRRSLFRLLDNNGMESTPRFWQDDSLVYRFVSIIQKVSEPRHRNVVSVQRPFSSEQDRNTWNSLCHSMIMTLKPKLLYFVGENRTHAVVAYRINGNRVYLADPRFPGDRGKYIQFDNESGTFDISRFYSAFSFVFFHAQYDCKTYNFFWSQVEDRSIGIHYFPSYKLYYKNVSSNQSPVELNGNVIYSFGDPIDLSFKANYNLPANQNLNAHKLTLYDGTLLRQECDGQREFEATLHFDSDSPQQSFGILTEGENENNYKYINFHRFRIQPIESQFTIIPAEADATVSHSQTDNGIALMNSGHETSLQLETAATAIFTGNDSIIYIRFNVSGIPIKSKIESADLYLFCSWFEVADGRTSVYEVLGPWNEYRITWITRPNISRAAFDPQVIRLGRWIRWDITKLVQKWVSGKSNNGVMLAANGKAHFGFHSREAGDQQRPVLKVEFKSYPE